MEILEEFVDSQICEIDYASFLDPDVEKIESTQYTKPIVYKYLSANRRSFFSRPQVRFTQRDALNDPFEMGPRWRTASTEPLRQIVTDRLKKLLPMLLNNRPLLTKMFHEELKGRGIVISYDQIESILSTPEGEKMLNAAQAGIEPGMIAMTKYAFSQVEERFQQQLDSLVSRWGIFSLSERSLNHLMWAHYADEGAGFVIGFDSSHRFFFSKETPQKNLLRKVLYSDQRIENFWNNPYYLFLVKNSDWSYEQEWRVFKELSECDEHLSVNGISISLSNVPPAAIKEVYFGYRCDSSESQQLKSSLIQLGCEATFHKVQVGLETGKLVPHAI